MPPLNPVESDPLLVPAPVVRMPDGREMLLYDWMRDASGDVGRLSQEITAAVYERLSEDALVRSYFPFGGDNEHLAELRRHFARMLLDLARDGLRQSAADHLAISHANIRNAQGEPITGVAYDTVADHVAAVLLAAQVQDTPECIGRLGAMLKLARPLLVRG